MNQCTNAQRPVLLLGELGVGKTLLLREKLRNTQALEGLQVTLNCDKYEIYRVIIKNMLYRRPPGPVYLLMTRKFQRLLRNCLKKSFTYLIKCFAFNLIVKIKYFQFIFLKIFTLFVFIKISYLSDRSRLSLCHSFTDGYVLSERLHEHTEWKAANYYDPKSSKYLICFIDNINMAKVQAYAEENRC